MLGQQRRQQRSGAISLPPAGTQSRFQRFIRRFSAAPGSLIGQVRRKSMAVLSPQTAAAAAAAAAAATATTSGNSTAAAAVGGSQADLASLVLMRRPQPVSLESLLRRTRFSSVELKAIYRRFKSECPYGRWETRARSLQQGLLVYAGQQGNARPSPNASQIRVVPPVTPRPHWLILFSTDKWATRIRVRMNMRLLSVIHEEVLEHILAQIFPLGNAHLFSHFVFCCFDVNRTGSVNFEQFALCLNVLLKGSSEERLRWIFDMYDINRDGEINRRELQELVGAVFELLGTRVRPAVTPNDIERHTIEAFRRLDTDGDGVISWEDFRAHFSQNPQLAAGMDALLTPIA